MFYAIHVGLGLAREAAAGTPGACEEAPGVDAGASEALGPGLRFGIPPRALGEPLLSGCTGRVRRDVLGELVLSGCTEHVSLEAQKQRFARDCPQNRVFGSSELSFRS